MELVISSLVGGLVGLLLGAMFEDALVRIRNRLLKKTRDLLRQPYTVRSPYKFAFGPIETSALIVEGDGETEFEDIVCSYDPNPAVLLPEIETEKKRIARREASRKRKGELYQWCGPTTALRKFARGRTSIEERLRVHLSFQLSDWYSYLAAKSILDGEQAQSISTRAKYFGEYNWANPNIQPHPVFTHTFGVAATLITDDDYLVLTKRGDPISVYSGAYHIPINETLSPAKDRADMGNSLDLFKTVMRGAYEELSLELRPSAVTFLALEVDVALNLWGMLGVARTNLRMQDIVDARRRGTKDRWESLELFPIKFRLNRVVEFVALHRPWSSGALACIYFTLVKEFGKAATNKAISRQVFPLDNYITT
jgi:hypothetical protein